MNRDEILGIIDKAAARTDKSKALVLWPRSLELFEHGGYVEPFLKAGKGRTFYAVGGAWRSLASLHMAQTGYPLHVMHGYTLPAREALEFCDLVQRVDPETLSNIEVVSAARRPLQQARSRSSRSPPAPAAARSPVPSVARCPWQRWLRATRCRPWRVRRTHPRIRR